MHSNNRNVSVDVLRTFAIVLMVIFHFLYDLKFFGFVTWDTPDGPGWRQFRQVILSSFFICLGVSLVYAHSNKIHWTPFFKRLAQITGSALLITLVSLIMVAENWIYFGVLHFIAVASVFTIFWVNRPTLSLLIGVSIIAIYNLQWVQGMWPFTYLSQHLPYYTNDYVGLFPWLGVVFLGIWMGHQRWLKNDPLSFLQSYKWLIKPGKHSLIIYLVHQPLFFGLFMLTALLTG